jgi:hypothetical protein
MDLRARFSIAFIRRLLLVVKLARGALNLSAATAI